VFEDDVAESGGGSFTSFETLTDEVFVELGILALRP